MVEVTSLGAQLVDFYKSLVLTLPVWLMDFINLFLLVFLIVIYSVFVWKFYRLISTKNLIELRFSFLAVKYMLDIEEPLKTPNSK